MRLESTSTTTLSSEPRTAGHAEADAARPLLGIYARGVKRACDILLALSGLLVLSPLMLLTAWRVRRQLGSPVLFRQPRAGLQGRPFELYKFRTMRDALDAQGQPLPDEQRLTPFGQGLRASSLDELPQLWNILRGDMSVVGPRPLLVRYLPRYSEEQARRHAVRPGITGWAQVNGRNAISWEEKFRCDVWYVDHISLWLDAKILALTVARVFQRKDISADAHATMPEFLGTAPTVVASDRIPAPSAQPHSPTKETP